MVVILKGVFRYGFPEATPWRRSDHLGPHGSAEELFSERHRIA
jgi:hypothetical protein